VTDIAPAIVAEDLRKSYGDRCVLSGVDLEVARGEVLALLGPNGAGKTTTIEILEGYRQPTGGSVRVLGFDPWTHPPRSTPELLEIVELTDDRATLVRRLSGGQRRRLDFALALAGDPDVIFLDEPTTGFDPEARRRCWSAIENLAALGKTILLTTHYLDEAERLADRVAILAGGRIRATGTSQELARLARTPTSISFTVPGEDERVIVRTQEPSATLQELIRSYGELQDLAVAPPTLEDSYLTLVADTEALAS
jgi:ABC-2 type transport system ATP-binding protein